MKYLLKRISSVLAVATAAAASAPAFAATDVYLFGGQSNMVQGIVDGFEARMLEIDPSQAIVTERFNQSSTGLDPGWGGGTGYEDSYGPTRRRVARRQSLARPFSRPR